METTEQDSFLPPQTAALPVREVSHVVVDERNIDGESFTTWEVSGLCGTAPWCVTYTAHGTREYPRELRTRVSEIEKELRYCLEPFLGVLCDEQVTDLLDAATDGFER